MKLATRSVVGLRSRDIMYSHILLVLHAVFGMYKQLFEYTQLFS